MHFSLWKQSRCFFSVFIVNMRLSYPKQNLICLDKLLGVLSLVQQQICLFFKNKIWFGNQMCEKLASQPSVVQINESKTTTTLQG